MPTPKNPDVHPGLSKLVAAVEPPVTAEDVDTFGRLQEIRDRSHWLRSIVHAWKTQQSQDRRMRRHYAIGLLIALAAQIVFVDVVYVLMGLGVLRFDAWTARTFIMAVFAEVAAMVFFIVKYLFRASNDKILELVGAVGAGKKGNRESANAGD